MQLYNPVETWSTRKGVSSSVALHPEERRKQAEFVKSHLRSGMYVLDYGCGEGRLAEAFVGCKSVVGVDIVSNFAGKWNKAMSAYSVDHTFLQIDESHRMALDDKYFDVAVATEVLLHVPPSKIRQVMVELARVADKVVCISLHREPFSKMEDGPSYCYRYDYLSLCSELGFPIEWVFDRRQIRFAYAEEL